MMRQDINIVKGVRGAVSKAHVQANPSSNIEKLVYVPANFYVITTQDIELITNGMAWCSALGFSTQGKVFLAHIPTKMESKISRMIDNIKSEFKISSFLTDNNIKIKVFLGTTTSATDSINTIMKVLYEIKLLNLFVQQLKNKVRANLEMILNHSSVTPFEIYKFLAIDNANLKDIDVISNLINKIKTVASDKPGFLLSQEHEKNEYYGSISSTKDLEKLSISNSYHCRTVNDYIIDLNIIIEKYFMHQLPGQSKPLLFGELNHSKQARAMQNKIEAIRKGNYSEADMYKELEHLLQPFIASEQHGGQALHIAFKNMEKPNFLPFDNRP